MNNSEHETLLINLLLQRSDNYLTGTSLESLSELSSEAFYSAAVELWKKHSLLGIKKNGCCENHCGPYCVSYMKVDQVWRFKKSPVSRSLKNQ